MNYSKVIASLLIVAISVTVVSLFWQQSVILSVILVVIALTKHQLFPIKREFIWFVTIGLLGSIGESLVISIGHTWSYSQTQLLNFPLWLPLLWGLAGTTAITLYQGITYSD